MSADPQNGVLCTWRLPDCIISSDVELTAEQAEMLKARFRESSGRSVELAPPLPEFAPPFACPDCGHSGLVHVGVEHCPVCELVWQSTPKWRAMQQRIEGWHLRTVMAR